MGIWKRTRPSIGRIAGAFLGGTIFGGITVGVAMILLSRRRRQAESQWEREATRGREATAATRSSRELDRERSIGTEFQAPVAAEHPRVHHG